MHGHMNVKHIDAFINKTLKSEKRTNIRIQI